VVIINDDTPGVFGFASPTYAIGEKGEKNPDGTHSEQAWVNVVRKNGSDGEITITYRTVDGTAISGDDFEPAVGELVFRHQEVSKMIKVNLKDDGAYEKSETFTIELACPGAPANGASLSEHSSVIVTILGDEDSAKVVNEVAALMKLQLDKLSLNTTSWGQQFDEAMSIQGEEGEEPAVMDRVMHVCTFGWKVLFAIVPPTCYKDGWVTFFVALAFVGLLTAFVADIAGIFGCLLGLQDSITAITFVALGTSLPDTFASKTAAVNDDSADASVGNVTGSNSVNVFLGLGLPWLLATIVHSGSSFQSDAVLSKGEIVTFKKNAYPMIAGSLGFSVVLFCICAITCIAGLYIRRFVFGYELGGTSGPRTATGLFFIMLWIIYVVVSSLEVEGHIKSFI
jgi:solute carrier family 8 (sodium/calcium exchanger)